MDIINQWINEIKREAESTKKIMERIPADQFDWSPHEKSMSLKHLAVHIAGLSSWPSVIAEGDHLDFAEKHAPAPVVNNAQDLVKMVDDGTKKSVEALARLKPEDLNTNWTLRNGSHVIFEMPKGQVIRSVAMNHLIHHRAQLGVYLRLLNIPIPGMYGPSADDK